MQLKTILNRVQKFKSFVYGGVRWIEDASIPTLEVEIAPRSNSRPECSVCGQRRPGYDRLPERRFEFIPMWGHKVFFVYAPRRVECPSCGIRVERMPWVVAPELERGRRGVPYDLGSCVLLDGAGRSQGTGTPGSVRC